MISYLVLWKMHQNCAVKSKAGSQGLFSLPATAVVWNLYSLRPSSGYHEDDNTEAFWNWRNNSLHVDKTWTTQCKYFYD